MTKNKKIDRKKRYVITQNIEDHEGYNGENVQIIEILVDGYFTVMNDRGDKWYCGEEELTEIKPKI